jgi:N-methylhydantoinase B
MTSFDAVSLEVLWTRLISIVDEAAKAIVRTSFSTLSNEANDFACILTDARGGALAQNSGSIPSFIATLPATVRHFLRAFGDDFHQGDVLITNDAWMGTGHMSDVSVLKPIFHRDRLVAFSATTAHMPDIGGRVRAIEAREIFEEGLHIPLAKLVRAGRTDDTLVTLIRANVRTPDQTVGDIWAQASANELMERRVRALLEDYRLDDLDALGEELFGRAERAMRDAIKAVPDGVYRYGFRTDGVDVPFEFRIALTVSGDAVNADYTGSSPQQPRAINCVLAYTYAMTAYAIRCALLPSLPNNEGMYRPVTVTAPEGCLLNPRFPAAVVSRSVTGHYVPVLVFGALRRVLPDRVIAGTGSPLWNVTQSGVRDDGRPYTSVMFFNGGMGATPRKDGEHVLSWPSNISSTPVEVAERNSPVFFHHKRLRSGSGGAGRFRGGLGQDILLESRSERPTVWSFMAERTAYPAPGFAGGKDGGLGDVQVNGRSIDHRKQHVLKKGDRVLVRTPGGGGYGPEKRRDARSTQQDLQLGYVNAMASPRSSAGSARATPGPRGGGRGGGRRAPLRATAGRRRARSSPAAAPGRRRGRGGAPARG